MASTKRKKAAAKKTPPKNRPPDLEVWNLPQFKALLDVDGAMTASGIKIMVENQRNINTELYESLETVIEQVMKLPGIQKGKENPLAAALAQVKKVPGSGPPECRSGGGGS